MYSNQLDQVTQILGDVVVEDEGTPGEQVKFLKDISTLVQTMEKLVRDRNTGRLAEDKIATLKG